MGSSLPEVLATVGIVTVLMSITALGLSRRHLDLDSAHQELVNAIREARLRATVKGSHFRLVPLTDSYEIVRLKDADGDGVWHVDADATPQTVRLPGGIRIASSNLSGDDAAIEFNTRGVAVDPAGGVAEVVHLTLTDDDARTRIVEVWPSGQVQGESLLGAAP